MSMWSVLLLIGCMLITGFLILVIYAWVDVRRRFRERDAEAAPSAVERAVLGCEGDCNTCPLQSLHVGLRRQIRANGAFGTITTATAQLGDHRLPASIGATQPPFVAPHQTI